LGEKAEGNYRKKGLVKTWEKSSKTSSLEKVMDKKMRILEGCGNKRKGGGEKRSAPKVGRNSQRGNSQGHGRGGGPKGLGKLRGVLPVDATTIGRKGSEEGFLRGLVRRGKDVRKLSGKTSRLGREKL